MVTILDGAGLKHTEVVCPLEVQKIAMLQKTGIVERLEVLFEKPKKHEQILKVVLRF